MSTDETNYPKIGAGHLAAMGRQGIQELRAAVYPESNVAQPPETGMFGSPTPQEILNDQISSGPELKNEDASMLYGSVIADRLPAAEPEPPQMDTREPELDR